MESRTSSSRPGALLEHKKLITYLDDGKAVCHDHHRRICHVCCLDLAYDPEDDTGGEESEGDDFDAHHGYASGDNEDEYEDQDEKDVEDPETVAQRSAVPPHMLRDWRERCFILVGSTARFVPQWEDELVSGAELTRRISLKQDMDNPPFPDSPSSLSLKYCTTCHLTWMGGRAGPDAVSNHPSHHTLYHEYSGTRRSLVVFVDGACASNGAPDATGGVGVFFGPNSSFNQSKPLELQPGEHPTSQKAEIHAVVTALRIIRSQILPARHSMCQAVSTSPSAIHGATGTTVLVATDSSYLVEAMCRHYSGWVLDQVAGKLRNKKGKIIEGSDGFRQIRWEVEVLSMMGVQVKYYQIPRAHNVNADALAKRAAQRTGIGK